MKKLSLIYHRRGGDVKKTVSFLKADSWEGEIKSVEKDGMITVAYTVYYAGGNARIEFRHFFYKEEVRERFERRLNDLLIEGDQRVVCNDSFEIWDI